MEKKLIEIEKIVGNKFGEEFFEKLKQVVLECINSLSEVDIKYKKGWLSDWEYKRDKNQIVDDGWRQIESYCYNNNIDLGSDEDRIYKTVHEASGILIKKVPIRYYPEVDLLSTSIDIISDTRGVEILYNDSNPVGKIFRLKKPMKIGSEEILLDYYFEVKSVDDKYSKTGDPTWKGWNCYEGMGRVEGYYWAEANINIREFEGELQSRAYQKVYIRSEEPIWKRRSSLAVEGYKWIGYYEDVSNVPDIPDGEYYSDETLAPPRGRNYKEYGVFAYDDTEEIVILGIKDWEAEIVEIPSEINGKPVTILDERCFANCKKI